MIKFTKTHAAISAATALVIGVASVAYAGGANGNGERTPQAPVGSVLGSADLWAVINADGTVARSDGAQLSATFKIAGFTGAYQIGFYRNLTGCNYVATIGNAGAGVATPGIITTAARAGVATAVFVQTSDTTGAASDRPFHLRVTC